MIIAIVDADPIVYRAGFAGEATERHIVWSPHDSNGIHQKLFRPQEKKTAYKQMKEWLDSFPEGDEPVILEDDKYVVPEPLENVLATVRSILRDTRYAIAENFSLDVSNVHVRALLSGPDNFRDTLATVVPYKGNRSDTVKPHWYQQIRNYLTDEHDAEVITGREADDECSILQLEYAKEGVDSVICSIDKDLDMVPGDHYDYVRKTFYFTGVDEGESIFYKQILSGDSTDNIPGVYKIGTVRAARIVDEYLLDNPGDWAGLWQVVLKAYDDSLTQYGEACPYYEMAHEQGVEPVAIEMARLVKMQEYIGQLWNPPGVPDDTLEEEQGYE